MKIFHTFKGSEVYEIKIVLDAKDLEAHEVISPEIIETITKLDKSHKLADQIKAIALYIGLVEEVETWKIEQQQFQQNYSGPGMSGIYSYATSMQMPSQPINAAQVQQMQSKSRFKSNKKRPFNH